MSSAEAKSLRESGHDVVYVNESDRLKGLPDVEHAVNAKTMVAFWSQKTLISENCDISTVFRQAVSYTLNLLRKEKEILIRACQTLSRRMNAT
jgi:hypothetical protein